MEMALFDWPIVLQYDVKAKYRLISRQSSGMKFFNQPKATPVCIRSINQSNRSICVVVCCFCFVRAFSFQGHTKIALSLHSVPSSFQSYSLSFTVYSISFHSLPIYGNSIPLDSIHCLFHSNLFHSIYCLFSVQFHSIPLHCSLSIKAIPISFIV